MTKDKYFIVDAETNGLYGDFISAAVIVTDIDFNELEHAYYGICEKNLKVTDEWVRENVLPKMGEYTECCDEAELLERVWELWMKYRETAYAIGDVIHPVESRLFAKCVQRDEATRKMLGPYPFLDVASILFTKGEDPLVERKNFYGMNGECQHNAWDDVVGIKNALQKLVGKKENSDKKPDRPYSYHTFMFPFIWETDMKIERKKVIEAIKNSNNWDRVYSFNSSEDEISLIKDYKNGKYSQKEFSENICELYQAKQYFTESARQLLYDEGYKNTNIKKDTESVVINYRFNKIKKFIPNLEGDELNITKTDEENDDNYWYVITKTEIAKNKKEEKVKTTYTYRLLIKDVFLSIYNSGVGILRLQMEYYGDKSTNGDSKSSYIEDFKRINECGRRIRLPYISNENYLTADSIVIGNRQEIENLLKTYVDNKENRSGDNQNTKNENEGGSIENFLATGNYVVTGDIKNGENDMIEAVSPYKVMNPITYFLNMFNFNEKYNSKIDNALRKKIVIKPTIDDRMYTYALINDWHVMTRNNQDLTREELYKLGFIDVRSCSCPDDKMREEIMDRCCYRRWLTYGTLDIITHHSFVRITGADNEDDKKDVKNAVIRPYLIQYNQMAQIALAQRATLLAMTDMASKISTGKGKSKNLDELHTKWVKALSQMMLAEVTVQEQGVEEFNMMRNEFYIPESMDRFEKQLEALYQKEENKKGHLLNCVLLVLAVAQAVGVLIPYIIDWFGNKAKLIKNEVELIGNRIRPIEIQMKLVESETSSRAVWLVLGVYIIAIIIAFIWIKIRRKK